MTEHAVRELEERIRSAVSELASPGRPLRYAGALLMPTDEVVLCLFEGSEELVTLAARRAGVPFDRIVPATQHAFQKPIGGDPNVSAG